MSTESPAPIRRVVTGHDREGVAKILWDGPATNVRTSASGSRSTLLWSTVEMPCDVALGEAIEDEGERKIGTQPPPDGNRFTINDVPPHSTGIMHRTESLDYAVILAGEIDMEVDGGRRVSLNAGDVVIQRGTNHSWINRGATWGRILFVLLDAKPLGIGHPIAPGASAGDKRPPA